MPNSPLINAEQVAKLERPKIFDVRGQWGKPAEGFESEYEKGHIPGAVFLNWTTHFLEPHTILAEAPVANYENAKKSFYELGINKDDTVILYDDSHHLLAARVWWAMSYWGHENVKVLNGGWQNWMNEGFEVSQSKNSNEKGSFEPKKIESLIISTEEVLERMNKETIVDARGEAGFEKGHIPGSINIPFRSLLTEAGVFKNDSELEQIFDGKIPGWRNQKLISSCGSGYSAAVFLLALHHLGYSAPLYDGSYTMYAKAKA